MLHKDVRGESKTAEEWECLTERRSSQPLFDSCDAELSYSNHVFAGETCSSGQEQQYCNV